MTSTSVLKSVSESVTNGIAILFLFSSVLHLVGSSFLEALIYLVISLLLFSYRNRLMFDLAQKHFVITKQLSLLNVSIRRIDECVIPLPTVTDVSLDCNKQLNYIGISYLSESEEPAVYSFSCLRQTDELNALLSASGFDRNVQRTADTDRRSTTRSTPTSLARLFPLFMNSNRDIEERFSVLRCALPTPKHKLHIVWMVVGAFALMTCFILYSSQNYIAGLVFLVLTYFSYWLTSLFISNKHYFVYHSPCNQIKVEENSLLLPALLFTDKQAREVKKDEVNNIKVHWNTFTVSDLDRLTSSTRRNHIVDLVFDTEYGATVSLSGMSVEAEPLLLALTHWQYPLSIERTDKAVFPMVRHFQYGILVFIIGIIVWAMTTFVI
ncbi:MULTISPECIES: hypothetical protein [unclassified Pseudoalteromonas]|uniref:hypothetical protein n=1 Tax=unclassified Pseudoalteromonas TaxID=194690 RepID=UPI001F40C9FB|nr:MULTISPECIES: hypothetical protein [unclassified Pseudoalteromonas]MCF2826459.1 hypothetical protein [Pseudoalteromonas sp. OF5H-5]MCF2833226.1 hypothetical protein [Pseudoalteromonas sp. DL2-H6]MCF2924679.1 hypothetical protein [Pseudoalteromonas sp. DL2-H1]